MVKIFQSDSNQSLLDFGTRMCWSKIMNMFFELQQEALPLGQSREEG
jgi:hypothetical protein